MSVRILQRNILWPQQTSIINTLFKRKDRMFLFVAIALILGLVAGYIVGNSHKFQFMIHEVQRLVEENHQLADILRVVRLQLNEQTRINGKMAKRIFKQRLSIRPLQKSYRDAYHDGYRNGYLRVRANADAQPKDHTPEQPSEPQCQVRSAS